VKQLNSGLAVLLVALVLSVLALASLPARAQDRSSTPAGNATPAPVLDDGGWITLGNWTVQWQPSTGLLRLLPLASPTPDAPSATPTATPTAPPSATPTLTPTASATPTATNTPGQGEPPTPTPETGEPPPTFTVTPGPEKACVLKNNASVTNIRSAPTTGANNIVNKWQPGAESVFTAFTTAEGYLWGRLPEGWAVVRSGDEWWVYGTQGSELCNEVPGWPVGLAPPPAIVQGGPFSTDAALVGPHFTYSIQESLVRQSAPYWTIVKCLVGAAHSCSVALDTQPGTVYVYRDVRIENPTDAELAYGARSYAQRVLAVCDARADYCEIMNERPMTHEQYSWLSDFLVGVGEEFNRAGRCMLAPAFAPGHPDLNQREWTPLVKWLQWANEHPCGTWPDGSLKFHGLSWHAAAYAPDWVDISRWPWVNWIFVAGNAILGNQQMIEDTGFGIQDFLGPKIVSELGFSDGYAGTPDQDASCDIKRALIQETARIYALHSDIFDAFNWWNIGVYAGGGWVDDSHCLPGLFQ